MPGIHTPHPISIPFFMFLVILLSAAEPLLESASAAGSPQVMKIEGYHTYDETNSFLYGIEENHSGIAKVYDLGVMFPHPDGAPKTSREGRKVLAIKISDNPDVNESDEPEIFICGMHHAREWMSVEVPIYFIRGLVDNYTTNATVRELVDTREIWVVPIVNPDGYVYSQNQMRMWRKNRRDNGGGSFGVDPNRNYGYKWGYDDAGSSPNPDSDVYRGPAPFSEPVTQLVRDLGESRNFTQMITFHSYGQWIIYPWGYTDTIRTEEDFLYEAISREMARHNGYTCGQGSTLLYPANGDTTDWFHANRSCFAYTIELGTEFIPSQDLIMPICEKNYEPCMIITKVADDPFDIFRSGISGKVTDTGGGPIEGVKVNATVNGFEVSRTSDADGTYRLPAPEGFHTVRLSKEGYAPETRNHIMVNLDIFTPLNVELLDIVPPAVASVTSSVDGDDGRVYEVADQVLFEVAELNGEKNLTGTVIVSSNSTGYSSVPLFLFPSVSGGNYECTWDTSFLEETDDYNVEAMLADRDGNRDENGSNDDGPDLVVELRDSTAPRVSAVDSCSGGYSSELYEVNSVVRIKVYEEKGEPNLAGTVSIGSAAANYSLGPVGLRYDGSDEYYYMDWDTGWLNAADDYRIESTLTDRAGNTDADGLDCDPDLVIRLMDTTSPEILYVDSSAVDPMGNHDDDQVYEVGSLVSINLTEASSERGLGAEIQLISDEEGYFKSSGTITYNHEHEDYRYVWDTGGLAPNMYAVETKLWDNSSNYDDDGGNNFGPDLVIELVDTISPSVSLVTASALVDPWGEPLAGPDEDGTYEVGSVVGLSVYEGSGESGLSGTVRIYSPDMSYDTGPISLSYDPERGAYVADWDTAGLSTGQVYYAEATLADGAGNSDIDGSEPGPDLVLSLDDTLPPVVSEVRAEDVTGGTTGNNFERGIEIKLVVRERHNESGLKGTLRITSDAAGFDSGVMDLLYDDQKGCYFLLWNTSKDIPLSLDYRVEARLADAHDNTCPDGLSDGPDLVLGIVDTVPPPGLHSLELGKSGETPGEVSLSWSGLEAGARVRIYRSKLPPEEWNVDKMIPLVETEPGRVIHTDNVEWDGTTYYYAVLPVDPAGNVNRDLDEENTAFISTSDAVAGSRTDASAEMFARWSGSIVVVALLIMMILTVFYVRRKRGRGADKTSPDLHKAGLFEIRSDSVRNGGPVRGRRETRDSTVSRAREGKDERDERRPRDTPSGPFSGRNRRERRRHARATGTVGQKEASDTRYRDEGFEEYDTEAGDRYGEWGDPPDGERDDVSTWDDIDWQ